MTQYEMTEQLSRKCDVTLEEARNALEAGNWNTLTATHLLEQEKFRQMQAIRVLSGSGEAMAVQFAPEEAAAEAIPASEAVETQRAMSDAIAAGEQPSTDAQAATAEATEAAEPVRKSKRSRKQTLDRLGGHARRLVACGNRNRLVIRKGGESMLELPMTVVVILMLCAFWVCVPLLAVGLFTGCRYSFEGKELGRQDLNHALDKAADTADQIRQSVAQA